MAVEAPASVAVDIGVIATTVREYLDETGVYWRRGSRHAR